MAEAVFISAHKNLKLNTLKPKVHFQNSGTLGIFKTGDEDLIKQLREDKRYNKMYYEGSLAGKKVRNGVRGAGSHPELGESEVVTNLKLDFYNVLKDKIVTKDGSFRKDASQTDISKFSQLKQDLNIQ